MVISSRTGTTAYRHENTRRTYRSAMRYWCAWLMARYGKPLTLPVSVPMVVQFIVDHTGRLKAGVLVIELPAAVDAQLVEARFKAALGPLRMATITNRRYVLSKLHQLRRQPNPCEDPEVRHLLGRAKRAAAERGETSTKKTAATREPLEAMLASVMAALKVSAIAPYSSLHGPAAVDADRKFPRRRWIS